MLKGIVSLYNRRHRPIISNIRSISLYLQKKAQHYIFIVIGTVILSILKIIYKKWINIYFFIIFYEQKWLILEYTP